MAQANVVMLTGTLLLYYKTQEPHTFLKPEREPQVTGGKSSRMLAVSIDPVRSAQRSVLLPEVEGGWRGKTLPSFLASLGLENLGR